ADADDAADLERLRDREELALVGPAPAAELADRELHERRVVSHGDNCVAGVEEGAERERVRVRVGGGDVVDVVRHTRSERDLVGLAADALVGAPDAHAAPAALAGPLLFACFLLAAFVAFALPLRASAPHARRGEPLGGLRALAAAARAG